MITRINEKWDPISWGWLSQNTFHTTSTVLVANLIPRRLGKEFYYTSGISSYILLDQNNKILYFILILMPNLSTAWPFSSGQYS